VSEAVTEPGKGTEYVKRWIHIRKLKRQLGVLKAENDRVFQHAFDSAPPALHGKRRLRWALEVLKTGDDYALEKALRIRIDVLSGRLIDNNNGTYTVVA
jgi:hypothetical protein